MKTNFFLNGQIYCSYKKLTIKDILLYFNYQNKIFVIEYNHIIYNTNKCKSFPLQNNDKIEIITIVGGG